MSWHAGSCHCGAVRFRVRLDTYAALDCNCSICRKKGFLHLLVEREDFEWLAGQDAISTYTFNTHTAQHTFCSTCGMHPFYVPRSHPEGIDVNARALDDIPVSAFEVTGFDGAHWEENVETIR